MPYYLGITGSLKRETFKRSDLFGPRPSDVPSYTAVVGPFRTKRAAEFMRDHGDNNPHCQTVQQAEELAAAKAIHELRQFEREHGNNPHIIDERPWDCDLPSWP